MVARRIAAFSCVEGELLADEVGLHGLVVVLRDGLDQLLAPLGGLTRQVGRDLLDRVVLALDGLAAPGQRPHLQQVDDTDEAALGADRDLQHQRGGAEPLDHHVDAAEEVRTGAVELVDEAHPRHVVLLRLPPDLLGLRLDTGDTVEHRDSTVEDAERALHLDGEVDVPGGVDDVDLVTLPRRRRGGGGDGDPPLLLLVHPVHDGAAVVDLADLVRDAGVEQDALGRGGLARVDMRHDPDVADLFQGVGGHGGFFLVSDLVGGAARLRCALQSAARAAQVQRRTGVRYSRPALRRSTTSGSARKPCSTRPSCGCPRAA